MRKPAAWFAVVLLTAAGCAQGTASSTASAAKASQPRGIVIQFGDMSLQPSVAHVKQGASVAWVSMAPNYQGVVSFPDSVVPHFTCQQLRPDFFEAAGRIQSIPVRNDTENLVLPCPLEPGSYEYRIDLFSGAEGMGAPGVGMGTPKRSLHGKLIVE